MKPNRNPVVIEERPRVSVMPVDDGARVPADFYREQAEDCRRMATECPRPDLAEGFEELAARWEKMAGEEVARNLIAVVRLSERDAASDRPSTSLPNSSTRTLRN